MKIKTKMKPKVWLSPVKVNFGKTGWCYALFQDEDGSIKVCENLMPSGFAIIGNNGEEKDSKDFRIYPVSKSDRRHIIQDLYVACCRELGIKFNPKVVKWEEKKNDNSSRGTKPRTTRGNNGKSRKK
jgi:hypothetical protein